MQNGNGQHAFWLPFHDREPLRAMRVRMDVPQPKQGAIPVRRGSSAAPQLAADLYETDGAVVLMMDMPGHDPGSMDVSLDKGILTVRSRTEPRAQEGREYHLAERMGGTVERSFTMPSSVDPERIDATFDAGVLTVTLLKREESKPRRIEVKNSS